MKLRTSFSNLTTFRKNITRFAPVWGLYLIGILLALATDNHYDYDRYAKNYIPDLINSFGVVNLIYAAVCSVMLFGDLYNTRMCYSLHTIPQKREHLFLSHLAAALCFSLVPNTVASLLLMARLQEYWFIALYWLLAVTLQFLFFFGVASLSAMLTGNRFAMLLVYAGINFVSLLIYWILNTIYLPSMPGVVLNYASFSLLTPVVKLFDWEYFAFEGVEVYSQIYHEYITFYEYRGLAGGWSYTAILAVLGLVFAGIALLLYKLRHLEVAGDFVAFRKLKNAACVIMTICVAGVAAFLGSEMLGGGMELWLIVGLVVGFFGSLMLLERRVKVFRKKTFLGFGALAAVLIVSFLMVVFDVFGIVHWVPKASEVESVVLSNYYDSNNGYNYDELYYGNRLSVMLTEKADIKEILTAHQDILDRLERNASGSSHRVVLTYTLNDGRKVIRSYHAPDDGVNYEIVSKYFYTPEQILGFTDWNSYIHNVEHLIVAGNPVPATMQEKFLNAVRIDCENGYIVTDRNLTVTDKEHCYWMDIEVQNPNGSYTYRNLCILPQAENTQALINSPEFILGYTDWNAYLDAVYYVDVSGTEIPRNVYPQFLNALFLDAQAGAISLDSYTAECTAILYIAYPAEKEIDRFLYITEKAVNTLSWYQDYKETLQ